jgi:glucosamine--fructose-6-phosphate aminotransferase (isomerizing)
MIALTSTETRMFAEAREAADAVERQFEANADIVRSLAERLRGQPPRSVVTYARGSSDHAATFAKHVIETRVGVLTSSGAPSIASVYRNAPDFRDCLALAISQSGQSPDILAAMGAAKSGGALTVALVNAEGSRLEAAVDSTVPLRAGPEQSVAATKSYIASLAAVIHLVAEWTGEQALLDELVAAPAKLRQAFECDWSPLVDCLKDVRGLYVIGRGPGLGVAQEAALKLKETCRIHAEAFSAAEVRHGPMELVGPDFPILVFRQSDESAEGVEDLARDVTKRGAPVFVAGAEVQGATALPVPEAHELIEPLLHIQALYRAANQLSVELGLDPDRPLHLRKVTETL